MEPITMYSTTWCPDCHRAKSFLKERGVDFREVDIENDPSGEAIVIKANNGNRIPHWKSADAFLPAAPSMRSSLPRNSTFR